MPSPLDSQSAAQQDPRHARQWLCLAVGVLILAGLFALLLVLGRMPPFDSWITDPQFFRRCLVVHVNLSLVLWFYSFIAALLFLLPPKPQLQSLARASIYLGVTGVMCMGAAAWMPGSEPVLSNYIPMIDHWLFGLGLVIFAVGVLAVIGSRRLLPLAQTEEHKTWIAAPRAVAVGLRAAAVVLILACLTFFSSWLALPEGLEASAYYELLAWGGGHVLQAASVLAMLSIWLILLGSLLGRSPIRNGLATCLFAWLFLPWMFAPLLPLHGAWSGTYRRGFTLMMELGIFPAVLVFLAICGYALHRQGKLNIRDYRCAGFLCSAGLTLLGFVLGAMISGSNTMIPAHYHANIGAITVAFMAGAFLLLQSLGAPIPQGMLQRLATWQPWIYGLGQMVFALGFALAGANGMERKTYGQEQAGRDAMETLGLVVMGLGGLAAIVGGIAFLWIMCASWRRRSALQANTLTELRPLSEPQPWKLPWKNPSTLSKN